MTTRATEPSPLVDPELPEKPSHGAAVRTDAAPVNGESPLAGDSPLVEGGDTATGWESRETAPHPYGPLPESSKVTSKASTPVPEAGTSSHTLGQRARSSSMWTMLGTIIGQGLSLLGFLATARLLTQQDIGTYVAAASVIGGFSVLLNISLSDSFIAQSFDSPEEMRVQLNTIWTAELLRRLLLSAALMLAAYPASLYFREPKLLPVLLVLGISPALGGLNSPGLMLLRREVRFGRLFAFDAIKNLTATILIVGIALKYHSVWAIVASEVGGSFVTVLLSYVLHSFRPRPMLDPAALRKAFSFGKYLFIISMMWFLTTNADNAFIARTLGVTALGAYGVVYQLVMKPGNALGGVISSVMFPVFAELSREGESERLERTVLRVFSLFMALLVVTFTPLVLLPAETLSVVSAKYVAEAPLLRVLALVGFSNGILLMFSPLLMGMNKPQLEARAKIIEAVSFLILLWPMVHFYGTLGAAWAGGIVHLQACLLRFNYARQLLPRATRRMPLIVGSALLCGVGGAALTWGILQALSQGGLQSAVARFWLGLPLCCAGTLALICMVMPALRGEFGSMAGSVLRRVTKATP